MSNISAALASLKTALADIDPTPQPGPTGVYQWPEDANSINWGATPFIIVAQAINRPVPVNPVARSMMRHQWPAEINIMLTPGPLLRYDAIKVADAVQDDWIMPLYLILENNRGLGGNAIAIGQGQTLFTYRVGNIGGWVTSKVHYGIVAELWVLQS